MSMTRKEAIKILQKRQRYCKVIANHANETVKADELREIEALNMAISILRPIRREQVDKVFPGCINCHDKERLAKHIHCYPSFCPVCGKPLTDEAVQMVMERLEALHDTGD